MYILLKEFFERVVELVKDGKCTIGQVIYEYTPKTKSEWIHISNHPSFFFSKDIVKQIGRHQFMQSLDGGKTYQIIK